MKNSRPVMMTAGALLLACFVGSVSVLGRLDAARPSATLQEVLYISSPKVLKRLSLGYDGLLADIYWTRAVQYFGARHVRHASQYNLLSPLLEITTTLDPHLLVAYQFGGNFLSPPPPNGAGMPEKAIQLIQYGIQNNPQEWKLYYQLGFVYYDLKDYASAREAFQQGSTVPNAHPFLKVLAAQMAQNARDFKTARMLWVMTYETIQEKQVRANALGHLRALRVDEDVSMIENAVTLYGERTGNLPSGMAALVNAGLLPWILIDPDGHPYELTKEGRVLVQNPDNFPFITKGVPPGYVAPPPTNLEKLLENAKPK